MGLNAALQNAVVLLSHKTWGKSLCSRMWHLDIIQFIRLKCLACFSFIRQNIDSSEVTLLLSLINNLAMCDPSGIPRHLMCAGHPRGAAAAAKRAQSLLVNTAVLAEMELGTWLVLIELHGSSICRIRTKWVRALPHISEIWIILSYIWQIFTVRITAQKVMHHTPGFFFVQSLPGIFRKELPRWATQKVKHH